VFFVDFDFLDAIKLLNEKTTKLSKNIGVFIEFRMYGSITKCIPVSFLGGRKRGKEMFCNNKRNLVRKRMQNAAALECVRMFVRFPVMPLLLQNIFFPPLCSSKKTYTDVIAPYIIRISKNILYSCSIFKMFSKAYKLFNSFIVSKRSKSTTLFLLLTCFWAKICLFNILLCLDCVLSDILTESLHLQALSTEANELLPIFNKTSSKFYRTPVPTADWSSQCGGGMATRQLSMSHNQGHRLPHGMEITHL